MRVHLKLNRDQAALCVLIFRETAGTAYVEVVTADNWDDIKLVKETREPECTSFQTLWDSTEQEAPLKLSGNMREISIVMNCYVVINSHGKTSEPFDAWEDAQAHADECNAESTDNTSYWVEAQER